MLSPRTAKYVEARIKEGGNFDYRSWLQRVRKEDAPAKQVPVIASSAESVAPETGNPTGALSWGAPMRSGLALPAEAAPIPGAANHKTRRESPKNRLRQRLVMVCNAWDDFQECRTRDAVYGYLKAVFDVVVECKGRRRTKRLLRRAFQFAGLPFDESADPFAAVIRCTSERSIDNKTISKWARALRYAAHCKRPRTPLKRFVKKMGGINACAERYAIYLGRGTR